MKKTVLTILSITFILGACNKNEQPNTTSTTNADTIAVATNDSAALAQYNKDEQEMIEKTDTTTYVSTDGKRTVKVIFEPEDENGSGYIRIQLKPNGEFERVGRVTANNGNPVFGHEKFFWESQETGGKGLLTENEGKLRTKFVIK